MGTHGLNEEFGRHRGREGKLECTLCGASARVLFMCCGSVQHIVVVEPVYGEASGTVRRQLRQF